MNLKTRARSAGMRHFSSSAFLEKLRAKARKRRKKAGEPPVVHYFHQVNDPYSHLAVQKLDELKQRYNLGFKPHLTSAPEPDYKGSAEHFDQWALRDATSVARDYGTSFTPTLDTPSAVNVALANERLAAHLEQDDFAQVAIEVGTALWNDEPFDPPDERADATQQVQKGNEKRAALGHYQGAMFYFDGEWFWGIDRIRSLEQRLNAEGFDRTNQPLCVPQPTAAPCAGKSTDGIVLEYFPSLRSPYTLSLIHI